MSVFVTGTGALTIGCDSLDELWARCTASSWAGISTEVGYISRQVGHRDADVDRQGMAAAFFIRAAREAIKKAALSDSQVAAAGLFVGTCGGSLVVPANRRVAARVITGAEMPQIADRVAKALGVMGPRLVVNTACASGAHAIAMAYEAIERGIVEIAIAGGADQVLEPFVAGFRSLGALTSGVLRPFENPSGIVLSEGSGVVVLADEPSSHVQSTPARPNICLRGYGASTETHHATAPRPAWLGPRASRKPLTLAVRSEAGRH